MNVFDCCMLFHLKFHRYFTQSQILCCDVKGYSYGRILSSCSINNGGVCDVTQGDRTYSSRYKGLIAKLTNLKYDVLMTCLDRDIQISKHKQFRHSNEINMKIVHIRFLRNHWFSNWKLPEFCKKLPVASGSF